MRKSWGFHGQDGWYVGAAPKHYICIRAFIPKTHKERITDTAQLIPHNIPTPHTTIESHLRRTSDDLLHLLNDRLDLLTP